MNILLILLVILNLSSKINTQFINNFNNDETEYRENFEFLTSEIFNPYDYVQEPDDIKEKEQDGITQQYISKVIQNVDTINLGLINNIGGIYNPNIVNQEYIVPEAPYLNMPHQNQPLQNSESSQYSSVHVKRVNPFFKRTSEKYTEISLKNSKKNPNPFFKTLSENDEEIPQLNESSLKNIAFNKLEYFKAWSFSETLNNQIQNLIKPQLEYRKSLEYATPFIAEAQYYQNFYSIYNFVESQQTEDPSQYEMEWIKDDFNGRSIVAPGQYPHMAAVGFLSNENQIEFKCGGSLISDSFIVTAAHCCYLNGDTPVLVKLGIINLKDQTEEYTPQNRPISEILIHPYYNTSLHYHDIALLKLQTPVKFTKFVRPIFLWASDDIPYERVFTMGYGSTSFAKAPTNILTELDLSLIPWQKCKQILPHDEKTPQGIVESQICAKDFEKNRDTCQGDSGGPLQLNLDHSKQYNNIRYYLVGIISYGEFCRGKHPGVYSRISSYSRWIASIVWPDYFQEFDSSFYS